MNRRGVFALAAVTVCLITAYGISRNISLHAPRSSPLSGGTAADCKQRLDLPAAGIPDTYSDVTEQVGLDFQHTVGPLGTYFMPESTGTGGAMFDFDGDGRLDIYLVNSGRSPMATADFAPGTRPENRMFSQMEDGKFIDVTEKSGLGDTGYGAGCCVGDVDNDGDLDVYITNYGPDRLYQNNGNGTFVDVTDAAGLVDGEWGTCAAFFDYNRDGLLDLVVVNYTADPTHGHSVACGFHHGLVSYCSPQKFSPTVDRLFRNDGVRVDKLGRATATFTDVTEAAGLTSALTYGFGVVCADFNRDGWPDIFIANDAAPNRLWINQRDGTFQEEGISRGVAYNGEGESEAGMGVAIGDVDSSGSFDLIVTHLSLETTTLYLNDGTGMFVDATAKSQIGSATLMHTGWGCGLVDLDHDGALDLPLVHGLVVPCHSGFPFHGEDDFQMRSDAITDPEGFWRDYADKNLLLMGDGTGVFHNVSNQQGGDFCAAIGSGRALVLGDTDNDGDIDMLVTNCGGRARLYRNDLPKQGHWLAVRAIDPGLDRDAYGAEITLYTSGKQAVRLASPAYSYLASNDPRVHFGLGDHTFYDKIIVRWPSGESSTLTEAFPGGPADRQIIIRRGEGIVVPEEP